MLALCREHSESPTNVKSFDSPSPSCRSCLLIPILYIRKPRHREVKSKILKQNSGSVLSPLWHTSGWNVHTSSDWLLGHLSGGPLSSVSQTIRHLKGSQETFTVNEWLWDFEPVVSTANNNGYKVSHLLGQLLAQLSSGFPESTIEQRNSITRISMPACKRKLCLEFPYKPQESQ